LHIWCMRVKKPVPFFWSGNHLRGWYQQISMEVCSLLLSRFLRCLRLPMICSLSSQCLEHGLPTISYFLWPVMRFRNSCCTKNSYLHPFISWLNNPCVAWIICFPTSTVYIYIGFLRLISIYYWTACITKKQFLIISPRVFDHFFPRVSSLSSHYLINILPLDVNIFLISLSLFLISLSLKHDWPTGIASSF